MGADEHRRSHPRAEELAAREKQVGERWIPLLLRTGLGIATVLMVIGLIVREAGGGGDAGHGLLMAGVVVLGFTPAARLLALIALWLLERDWRYAALTALTVTIIAVSIALGAG